ncbi:hypothetical protein RT717_17600 [Imperialibacter roseus]|uniref:Outer membrane protein beta-barrel domain-containing protein n=1 Tax=Imperialibacter roseus TaxID=1324217 RepID=A0ABZ0ILN1_9BACT|nr:hypothetical protein [Imperialibacter roseus]WOK04900.1 hypothetical protein RT717_17600 [Imperialibacter roseus]
MKARFHFIILTAFVGIYLQAEAQHKTYLGFELGPKYEKISVDDLGGMVGEKPIYYSPAGGFIVGQEISQGLLLETGLNAYKYGVGFRLKSPNVGLISGQSYAAIQIPVRLKSNFGFFRERLKLSPFIGYSFVHNMRYEIDRGSTNIGGHSSSFHAGDESRLTMVATPGLRKNYSLIEAGVSVSWQFKNSFVLYINGSSTKGFKKMTEIDGTYQIGNGPEQSAKISSNGDFYNMLFGVKFPISPAWQYRK